MKSKKLNKKIKKIIYNIINFTYLLFILFVMFTIANLLKNNIFGTGETVALFSVLIFTVVEYTHTLENIK